MITPAPPAALRAALAMTLALLLGACTRSEHDWLANTQADDPFVRMLAVVALGQSEWGEPEEVVQQLILAMGDPDREVSRRAGEALLANERRVFPILLRKAGLPDAAIREQLTVLARRLGPDALSDLRDALAEPAPVAGPFLVELLRQLGPPGRAALLEASRHEDDRVRRVAVSALASDPVLREQASTRLAQALEDPSPAVRELALRTVVGADCDRLDDADEAVRAQAATRLRSLGAVAVREMTRLLLEGDEPRRASARSWLAACEPTDVPAFLAAHHRGESRLSARDVILLAEHIEIFGEPAVPLLRRELGANEPVRRMAAAAALCGLGSRADAARVDLLPLLDDGDEDVRLTAALALMHIGVTDDMELEALVDRALSAARAGEERSARALGTAAVGGLLRQMHEAGPAATADAGPDSDLARIDAWGPDASSWLVQVAEHALDEELRIRANGLLAAQDARAAR